MHANHPMNSNPKGNKIRRYMEDRKIKVKDGYHMGSLHPREEQLKEKGKG